MGTAGTASTKARRSDKGNQAPTPELVRALLPCEIRVVNEESREIEICATSEAIDGHGTIFGYDASKDAFSRWAGNVREMHERKAVGRRVAIRYDDDARKVYTRLRISKGADDTWEKVKDGTLAGASIGASNVEWTRRRAGDRDVPYATRYDLVELSLVDLPSNADAQGVTFMRVIADGSPDDAVLETLQGDDVAPAAAARAPVIREGAGSLAPEDVAAEIAARALAEGRETLEKLRVGDASAGRNGPEPTPNELRLARLGAPGYVERVQTGLRQAAQMQLSSVEKASEKRAGDPGTDGPGASFDGDGDHDGNVPLVQSDGLHAFEAHDHPHTGAWDDTHSFDGPHQHEDGTMHTHAFALRHNHHDHFGPDGSERAASRAADGADGADGSMSAPSLAAGHAHPHIHRPDHSHYYRVADSAPLDNTLVTGEQLRTREYVSSEAFRAAGGVEGHGLSAAQYRIAAGVEARLELAAAERAQGAFSRNPLGPADIGTPAQAAETSTDAHIAASATGQVNDLDRDGQPTTCDDTGSTGTLDVSTPPDGFAELTGRRVAEAETERAALVASITAAVSSEVSRALGVLGEIEQRVARIEAQPMPGGPVFRVADKTTPLSPTGGQPSVAQRIQALEGLQGQIRDPQAQVAVAAEMIRLQQEAAGMPPAMQVMPRAGRGWGE